MKTVRFELRHIDNLFNKLYTCFHILHTEASFPSSPSPPLGEPAKAESVLSSAAVIFSWLRARDSSGEGPLFLTAAAASGLRVTVTLLTDASKLLNIT